MTKKQGNLVMVQPFRFNDKKTGNLIEIKKTPNYSILVINGRNYYFDPETGEFDGISSDVNRDN